jgi:threonyl-tRNA synthetase
VRVLPITDDVAAAAAATAQELRDAGIRVRLDDRAETLGYKIREAETHKVPYMAVVGTREAEAATVAVRRQGAGKKQEIVARTEFIARLREEIDSKRLPGSGS